MYDRAVYLPPILARQDRMSMAHAIEARVPFLSNRFLQMPPPAVRGKRELKDAAAKIFGNRFARRRKVGFGFPVEWLGALDAPHECLDWLRDRWVAQDDLQQWALNGLAAWSKDYLYGGWKEHTV